MACASPCVVPSWYEIRSLLLHRWQSRGTSVGVDDIQGQFGASYPNVMHCNCSVYLVESIDGVNQEDFVCTIIIKNLGHGVYGGLSTSTMNCADLQGSGCPFDLLLEKRGYGLASYSIPLQHLLVSLLCFYPEGWACTKCSFPTETGDNLYNLEAHVEGNTPRCRQLEYVFPSKPLKLRVKGSRGPKSSLCQGI